MRRPLSTWGCCAKKKISTKTAKCFVPNSRSALQKRGPDRYCYNSLPCGSMQLRATPERLLDVRFVVDACHSIHLRLTCFMLFSFINSVTTFMLSKAGDNEAGGGGCKDGCFWTIVSSGTWTKAICLSLSQSQHELGCKKKKTCDFDCPSQLWKILFSNFRIFKTIENFVNVHLSGNSML